MSKAAKLLDRAGRSKPMLYGIAALLSAGFGVFVILTAEKVNVYYPIPTAVIFGGLFFLAQALLLCLAFFPAQVFLFIEFFNITDSIAHSMISTPELFFSETPLLGIAALDYGHSHDGF